VQVNDKLSKSNLLIVSYIRASKVSCYRYVLYV